MLVDATFLEDVNHGSQSCTDCHKGDPEGLTRAEAHVGMVADPTVADAAGTCGSCHAQTVADSANSLHTTLAGLRNSLLEREGGTELSQPLQQAFNNHCSRCHSSCGDCHVSTPNAAGGGLLAKHRFQRKPSMTLVCTACHGSRVGAEYRGENAGIPADVHYNKGMQCTACHSGAEMHGSGGTAKHRYEAPSAAKCADCHPDTTAFKAITAHTMHRDDAGTMKLSCYVCHAGDYKTCSTCHVEKNAEGKAVYTVNEATNFVSPMTFKIGLNPLKGTRYPSDYVTVRHVPAHPDNYSYYGENLQPAFDSNPTWRMATPHNIQRTTPRSATCNGCHGDKRELFLGPADVEAYESNANAAVMVPDAGVP